MTARKISRAVWGWISYDAAASGFTTIIMATFFPALFKNYWSHGVSVTLTTARLGTVVSVSSLIIAVITPWLGAIADHHAIKKRFLAIAAFIAMLGSVSLMLISQGDWQWAAAIYALSLMGYYAANTFYDSLLPSVATKNTVAWVSSLGYGAGYLTGGLWLVAALVLTAKPHWFGLSSRLLAIQVVFVAVAVWWLSVLFFGLWRNVPELRAHQQKIVLRQTLLHGWHQVWATLKNIRKHRALARFLLAYWLYIDAVFSVITMAVDYGLSIGFKTEDLIAAILLTQFIGFPSAIVGGILGKKFGCKRVVMASIMVYVAIIIWAALMHHVWEFFCLAALVGLAQGNVQAQSRALFTKLIPPNYSAQFFGFFNLVNKFSAIIGPLLIGWVSFALHSNRWGIATLIILLLIGLILLWPVRES